MTTKYFLSILILSFILSEITSYFYQTSIIKKKQFNVLRTIELQLQGKKIADEEWNKIKKAIDTNPDEWKSALVSKRSELASLKSSGALDGIVEGALDEDSVAQIDQIRLDIKAKSVTKSPLLRKRLLRSASKSTAVADEEVITEKETISEDEDEDDNDNDEEGEGDEDDLVLERLDDILDSYSEDDENSDDELVNIMTSDRKTFALLRSKYASTFIGSNVTAVGLYGFLNEVKDKKVHDTEFIENIVFSFSRLKVAKTAISAFKIYYKLWQEKLLIPQPENMRFGIDYANTCYVNNMEVAGDELRALLLADGHAVASDFVIGELCASIHNSVSASSASDSTSGNTKKNKKISAQDLAGPVKSQELVTKLQQLHTDLKQFSVAEINTVIRVLGKYKFIDDVFSLFATMRAQKIEPNDESYEFLSASLVATVREEASATTMKDLPSPDLTLPEIVFAGRSNVGKSSLVNFLVGRKALASTSATPGHTSRFHFFNVNAARGDLPAFRLVDVPGLGYAEAEEGVQDSWRALLERYTSVRSSLSAVFHLVDSRHQVTATDKQLMEIMRRAAVERASTGRPAVRYVIVLTKIDKASKKELAATRKDVDRAFRELLVTFPQPVTDPGASSNEVSISSANEVTIVETSATTRTGRDHMWKLILKLLTERQ